MAEYSNSRDWGAIVLVMLLLIVGIISCYDIVNSIKNENLSIGIPFEEQTYSLDGYIGRKFEFEGRRYMYFEKGYKAFAIPLEKLK